MLHNGPGPTQKGSFTAVKKFSNFKINKAKKRTRQPNNDGPNNLALSRKLKKTTKILIQNLSNFSILFPECQIQI